MCSKFKFTLIGFLFSFLSSPLFAQAQVSVEKGGSVVINLRDYITDNTLYLASAYVSDAPANGSIAGPYDGLVTYTHNWGGGTADSFTFNVSDYNAIDKGPFTINISIGGNAATGEVANVAPGGTTIVELITDYSVYNPNTMYVTSPVRNGYLEMPYAGAIRYTHNSGAGWDDIISFVVADYDNNYTDQKSVNVRVDSNTPSVHYQQIHDWQSNNNTNGGSGSGGNNGGNNSGPTTLPPSTGGQSWWQPLASENLKFQLQLQGDIRIIDGVKVYAADVTASQSSIDAAKATGAKLKCYISAGSIENWRSDYYNFPSYVIGNAYDGWPGEWWLNTRDIDALAPVMRARLDECARKGFDAIDADNVNGFENNTGFNLSRQDSINYIRWLAEESHARGLAFSLKNSETLIDDVIDSVDMLQSESCVIYGNCDNASKMTARNKPVFAVEYSNRMDTGRFWNEACSIARNNNFSMIYRDLALTPYGVYQSCQ